MQNPLLIGFIAFLILSAGAVAGWTKDNTCQRIT